MVFLRDSLRKFFKKVRFLFVILQSLTDELMVFFYKKKKELPMIKSMYFNLEQLF
jgi:hypothetical protein